MERRILGRTGIEVSRLCFGTLVMGPLQRNLSPEAGGALLAEAYRAGVDFIDTAELYETYAHIRFSIRESGIVPVISAKSYAYTADGAKASVGKALTEMGVERIDLFLLHEQESEHTLRGHAEALEALLDLKRQGVIRAVGVSTHHVACVKAATAMAEIDVIHPLLNKAGLGICDGSAEDMTAAVKTACEAGKGLYGMKVFGGGNLLGGNRLGGYADCLRFALENPWFHSLAIGMQDSGELRANLAAFEAWSAGRPIPEPAEDAGDRPRKAVHVDFWCEGCGKCVARCGQGALSISGGKAAADSGKCVLCGYCAASCPVFALKVY